jgi:magnesium chelatase family protein
MIAAIRSATVLGVTGQPVTVEVHVAPGLPAFQMVGLPDEACRESRDRVRAAVLSSQLPWPQTRITVNLAPSSVRKGGSGLDLAIAVGVLVATDQIDAAAVARYVFVGELGLDGALRPLPGVAPMVASHPRSVPVVPTDSWYEATAVVGDDVRCAGTLNEVVNALTGGRWPEPPEGDAWADEFDPPDLADVCGQHAARTGLEIAAAGGHHLLLVGPPGSGKTMIAQRLVGLLPPLDPLTALEATMVHSAAGARLPRGGVVRRPVFRAPHHSASMISLVGGGSTSLRPGEISLAHGGILFMDELGEFSRVVLDSMRQPLEEGVMRISRAHVNAALPARFLLVAATNPCPCGGGAPGSCECDEGDRKKYLRRLSGPLLDRFDLRVGVERTPVDDLISVGAGGESTAVVAARVADARAIAIERQGVLNAELGPGMLDEYAPVTPMARSWLRDALERELLSGRGLHRIRRVARTIADLDGRPGVVDERDVVLAMQLRVDLKRPTRRRELA